MRYNRRDFARVAVHASGPLYAKAYWWIARGYWGLCAWVTRAYWWLRYRLGV
jgi:hypothetical protein